MINKGRTWGEKREERYCDDDFSRYDPSDPQLDNPGYQYPPTATTPVAAATLGPSNNPITHQPFYSAIHT